MNGFVPATYESNHLYNTYFSQQELEEEYIISIIEYLDSIKMPEIVNITKNITKLMQDLNVKISMCKERCKFNEMLFFLSAKCLFQLKKTKFGKVTIEDNSKMHKGERMQERRHRETVSNKVENEVKANNKLDIQTISTTTINNQKDTLKLKQNKIEQKTYFAKRFCSKSIKSSCNASKFKDLDNILRKNMQNLISQIKKDVSSDCKRKVKRKRGDSLSENGSETVSLSNCLQLFKRLKLDAS